jgi:hypothetical protein
MLVTSPELLSSVFPKFHPTLMLATAEEALSKSAIPSFNPLTGIVLASWAQTAIVSML